jgi:F-type H+-transporting ATPase subunit b
MTSFLSPVLAAGIMDLRPGLSLWTAITFILLMFVLSKYAWGPIVKMLDQREHTIRDAIEQAKKERAEAEKMLSDQTAALAAVQREAAAMAERSRKDVETLRADLTAKARKEADDLVVAARSQIQEEKAKALAELKNQVADLAIDATRRIIQSSLDEKAQRALVEEYIASLPTSKAA